MKAWHIMRVYSEVIDLIFYEDFFRKIIQPNFFWYEVKSVKINLTFFMCLRRVNSFYATVYSSVMLRITIQRNLM